MANKTPNTLKLDATYNVSPAFKLDVELDEITIFSDRLRRFIWDTISQKAIDRGMLIYPDDSSEEIRDKNRNCVASIADIDDWIVWIESHPDHDCDGTEFGDIADIVTEWKHTMLTACDEFDKKVAREFTEGNVTFPGLQSYLNHTHPMVCIRDAGKLVYGKVNKVTTGVTFTGHRYANVKIGVVQCDRNGVTTGEVHHVVYGFAGKTSLTELDFVDITPDVLDMLLARGKRFIEITTTPQYLQYTGDIQRKEGWTSNVYPAHGRCMIDRKSMRQVVSNYDDYYADTSSCYDDDDDVKIYDRDSSLMDDDTIRSCVPFVYGFSFELKVWGRFDVDHLANIDFRTDAFDQLVLDQQIKDMLFALVDTTNAGKKDFIDGKGGGNIFLLAGPPGCGKTLTAESIAEVLQRPLYMVSVGELGTNVEDLEYNLKRILKVAQFWNAVLLIDECDIFMEKRDDLNIERNAMVGIFLRLLEYYQGTLFLTTNRASSIDDAFYSRLSLAIRYEELGTASKLLVWTRTLALYDIVLTSAETTHLANFDINGRQIKNCVRIAAALAQKDNRKTTVSDITGVIGYVIKFKEN